MGRFFLLVLVILLSVGIPVLCGFTLLEAIIIFTLGVFWIGFLGWMLRKCKYQYDPMRAFLVSINNIR